MDDKLWSGSFFSNETRPTVFNISAMYYSDDKVVRVLSQLKGGWGERTLLNKKIDVEKKGATDLSLNNYYTCYAINKFILPSIVTDLQVLYVIYLYKLLYTITLLPFLRLRTTSFQHNEKSIQKDKLLI